MNVSKLFSCCCTGFLSRSLDQRVGEAEFMTSEIATRYIQQFARLLENRNFNLSDLGRRATKVTTLHIHDSAMLKDYAEAFPNITHLKLTGTVLKEHTISFKKLKVLESNSAEIDFSALDPDMIVERISIGSAIAKVWKPDSIIYQNRFPSLDVIERIALKHIRSLSIEKKLQDKIAMVIVLEKTRNKYREMWQTEPNFARLTEQTPVENYSVWFDFTQITRISHLSNNVSLEITSRVIDHYLPVIPKVVQQTISEYLHLLPEVWVSDQKDTIVDDE